MYDLALSYKLMIDQKSFFFQRSEGFVVVVELCVDDLRKKGLQPVSSTDAADVDRLLGFTGLASAAAGLVVS